MIKHPLQSYYITDTLESHVEIKQSILSCIDKIDASTIYQYEFPFAHFQPSTNFDRSTWLN
mgnify:CR=1 FL=1